MSFRQQLRKRESTSTVHREMPCSRRFLVLHNLGLDNSTCVADVCFNVRNLGGSVVSDCGVTRPAGGTPLPLRCLKYQANALLSVRRNSVGTQPVRKPLPLSVPNIDSVVDVCIDGAEEGSCVVSDAHGSPIEGDPSAWTGMTNDYLIDDGFTAGEPWMCANLSLGGSIQSEFNGSEGIADTYDGDGLAFQKEGTRGLRGQVEGNSNDRSDMPPRRLHLRKYPIGVTTTLSQFS